MRVLAEDGLRVYRGLAAIALLAGAGAAIAECPDAYPFSGQVDYFDPQQQAKIRGIESNHLNSNVENLIRGQSTTISGDLRFILNIIPNHHRALNALARLALREHKDKLPETAPYTVECWLHRATVFNPKDARARLIYGVYLSKIGRKREALAQLEQANALDPDDANISYDLGLMYFDAGDYARSLQAAKRAYAEGFPLQGLRNKLEQAGQWRD